jgi:hypothetical protein
MILLSETREIECSEDMEVKKKKKRKYERRWKSEC